jgi:ABC-type nitrate/sulfonate/bicarbonate transport system permease component
MTVATGGKGMNGMKRTYSAIAAAAVVLGCWAAIAPARAAPPTVIPSPGYDARLQEQKAAASSTVYEPFAPVARPRGHVKRARTH